MYSVIIFGLVFSLRSEGKAGDKVKEKLLGHATVCMIWSQSWNNFITYMHEILSMPIHECKSAEILRMK